MKNLLTLAILAVLVSACQKDPVINTPKEEFPSTLKFTVNGTVIELNGSLAINSYKGSVFRRSGNYSSGNYTLVAKDNGSINSIRLPLHTDTISATTYMVTVPTPNPTPTRERAGSCDIAGVKYAGINSGDTFTLTISNIHDGGYADGTFSAQMSRDTQKIMITNGEFKNVKILL
jgi:hypothetical protein